MKSQFVSERCESLLTNKLYLAQLNIRMYSVPLSSSRYGYEEWAESKGESLIQSYLDHGNWQDDPSLMRLDNIYTRRVN